MIQFLTQLGQALVLVSILLCNPEALFAGGRSPPAAIHPRVIVSESGGYSLKLSPSDLNARFHANYTLSHKDQPLWTKELPFTLLQAAVTNTGHIVGYAYTHGEEGFGKDHDKGNGDFVIAIIDRDGKPLLVDKHEREDSRFFHSDPDPTAKGMVVDEANDRLIVRVRNPDLNIREEAWWPYKISTGRALPITTPTLLSKTKADPRPIHVRAVKGTNLYLVQWWLVRFPERSIGTMFSLHEENGVEVWSMSLPKDYTLENEEEQSALQKQIGADGAILANPQPKTFCLHFYADKARVNFEVGQNKKGEWSVQEKSREEFRNNKSNPTAVDQPAQSLLPRKHEASFQSIELKPFKAKPTHPIRNIHSGFDFDSDGNIGFVRHESGSEGTFLLVDTVGKVLITIPLAVEPEKDSNWDGVAFVGESQFIATLSGFGKEAEAKAWRIDTKKKSLTRLTDFKSPAVECIASGADGSFVVLACERSKYTMTDSVSKHDSSGRRLWTIPERYEDFPKALFSPESLCVSDTGEVLVLDNIEKKVQVFHADGTYSRVIDLEEQWGREPNYPTEIASAPDHGLLVYDFQGSPSMVMMRASGAPKFSFDARLAKNGPPLVPHSEPKMDAEGRVWMSDGDTILRLGTDGIVDRVLGEVADSETMGEVESVAIDREGNIAATSRRSRVVHQFDRNGAFQRAYMGEADRGSGFAIDPVLFGANGDIYIQANEEYDTSKVIRFSSDGVQREELQFAYGRVQPLGITGSFLSEDRSSVSIIKSNGELVRKIERQPDGNWLEDVDGIKVARNGDFAVLTTHFNSVPSLPNSINLFSATGDPIRTLAIPNLQRFAGFDFDGETIVVCSPEAIVLFDSHGNAKFWLDYPGKKKEGSCQVTLTKAGRELVIVDRNVSHSIFRVELPAEPLKVAKPQSIDELLLFFPAKYPTGDWQPKELRFDDVYFAADDKTKLHGWYCPCENPRGVILLAHGNAGHVASRATWLRYLQSKARVSVFLFDYRGYGRSEGTPTVEGLLLDARAARAKLCELASTKESEIILMGESLGGAIFVQLAAEVAPRGLILQSTFSSLKDVADVHYPKLSWLVPSNKLDSLNAIAKYRGPLLQSHGDQDRTIPFASGEKLFQAANEPKTFTAIPNADHNNWLSDDYLRQLNDFVNRIGQPGK